jgi:glucose/arabinose dehydrogenase
VLFVSVGAATNRSLDDDPARAVIIACEPDGRNKRTYARGLRNAIGIAVSRESRRLWATVNERGGLGDDLPPDYFTEVREGGFYGFPYSYVGAHVDARVTAQRRDLVSTALVPDVLLTPHAAPMQFAFYESRQFPSRYRHGAFIAEHGSSNRSRKSGYDVLFVPFRRGQPQSDAEVFLSGFVPDPAKREAYGRPVGVAVAADGSLLVSDDGAKKIWRIAYAP